MKKIIIIFLMSFSFFFSFSFAQVDYTLQAHYSFDTNINDSSINGRHLSWNNNNSTFTWWYIFIPSWTTLSLPVWYHLDKTRPFTIAIAMKWGVTSSTGGIVSIFGNRVHWSGNPIFQLNTRSNSFSLNSFQASLNLSSTGFKTIIWSNITNQITYFTPAYSGILTATSNSYNYEANAWTIVLQWPLLIWDLKIWQDYKTVSFLSGIVTANDNSLYSTQPSVSWLCSYQLWLTWNFNTWSACVQGTFSNIWSANINWYTGYSWECLWISSWSNAVCYTAQQTTWYCGTKQAQTFYQDINDYTNSNFCSWWQNWTQQYMTWLSYVAWDWRTWYCNWPTWFWSQSFCFADDYQDWLWSCWPAHLQTFNSWDLNLNASWENTYYCNQWEVVNMQFDPYYWYTWQCEAGTLWVECVWYLSWWITHFTPRNQTTNPFDAVNYNGNQTNILLNKIFDRFPAFRQIWTIFTTYFVFTPYWWNQLSYSLPSLSSNWQFSTTSQVLTSTSKNITCNSTDCTHTKFWKTYTFKNNNFYKFVNVFVPVIFAFLYVLWIVTFILIFFFAPLYLLFTILTPLSNLVFDNLDSSDTSTTSFILCLNSSQFIVF